MKKIANPRLLALAIFVFGITASVYALELVPETPWCGPFDSPTRMDLDIVNHLLYVSSPRTGEISVLNQAGMVLNVLTGVAQPTALAVDDVGNLYVADGRAVRKLDQAGTQLLLLGNSDTYFINPHDICVSAGLVYVADVNDSIKVFRPDGSYVRSISRYGYFPGRVDDPVALATDPNGTELYVSDQNNHRVQVFDSSGVFQRTWGSVGTGDYTSSQFLRPFGLDVDEQGRVWVLDALLNTVQVFNPMGQFLFMCRLDQPVLRDGVDLAIDGDMLFVTSPSLHCVLPYRIVETEARDIPEMELTITLAPGGLQLRWQRMPGVASYRVQRCDDVNFSEPGIQTLGVLADTFFTDAQAQAQWDKRFYRVTAEGLVSTCTTSPFGFGSAPLIATSLPPENDGEPPILSHDRPHTVTYGVRCNSCHFTRYSYPNPFPEWWFGDHLCKSCHVETGKAQPQQNHFTDADTMYCEVCHDPHDQQDQFPRYFIRTAITTPHNGDRNLWFNHATDFIHGAPDYDGICETCHTQTAFHRNNAGGDHQHFASLNCVVCHDHRNGFRVGDLSHMACNSCHGMPPATGAHFAHVATGEGMTYGDLRQTSDFGETNAYRFGCGQCHSLDAQRHRNGSVDLELYNPQAPAGSLKGRNPSNASYQNGTCRNTYCHSSGTEEPFRTYADAEWTRTTAYGCGDCHGEPPTYPSQSTGGVGANSHYRYNASESGEDAGHILGIHGGHNASTVANGSSSLINCNTCHFGVVQSNTNVAFTQGDATCGQCHNELTVPPMGNRGVIFDKAQHVSGSVEVQFAPAPVRTPFKLYSAPSGWTRYANYDEAELTSATYNPANKTCSNVACHLSQTNVQWGYRDSSAVSRCACHNIPVTNHTNQTGGCQSCHRLHETDAAPTYMLNRSVTSDVCLQCHATNHGSVLGPDPLNPPPELGGGNFCFLQEDNLNDSTGTPLIPGNQAGHNCISVDYAIPQDPEHSVAPGGTYPSSQLGCTSCHDPHGNTNYRILRGPGRVAPGNFNFTYAAPSANGIALDGLAESPNNHPVYRRGWSDWCRNCHGRFHKDQVPRGTFKHNKINDNIGGGNRDRYNRYAGSTNINGGSQATSYLPLVALEDSTLLTNSPAGPTTGNAKIVCVTCHRAHASSQPHSHRWEPYVAFMSQDGVLSGSWPIPSPYEPAASQRQLCNKCHSNRETHNPGQQCVKCHRQR